MNHWLCILVFQENPSETTTEPTTNECERPDWVGDDYCDDETNNAACNWDGGDCCNNDKPDWRKFCKVCECLDPDESAGTCVKPEWRGDTYCDDETNNPVCNWDGGDCCNNDNPKWNATCTICECITDSWIIWNKNYPLWFCLNESVWRLFSIEFIFAKSFE